MELSQLQEQIAQVVVLLHPPAHGGFEVVGERSGFSTLTATRQVTTLGELLPSIMITEPPELGSDGRPHIITIHEQMQYTSAPTSTNVGKALYKRCLS